MLNNKTYSTVYTEAKASTYPDLNKLERKLASRPYTPTNTPSSSYAGNGSSAKFYISSSSSFSSEIDNNDINSSTHRRYTL